jgi:hypothetical protein
VTTFDPKGPLVVTDPQTGEVVPGALRCRAGSAPGVSFRVKAPERVELGGGAEGSSEELGILRWKRVGVISGAVRANGAPKSFRFWVLEPGPTESEIELAGFYVRGPFKVVERINNDRRAREAWAAFRPA